VNAKTTSKTIQKPTNPKPIKPRAKRTAKPTEPASAKAIEFAGNGEALGWSAEITVADGISTVVLSRDAERITLQYSGNVFISNATYANGDYSRTLRNKAAALRKAADSPSIGVPSKGRPKHRETSVEDRPSTPVLADMLEATDAELVTVLAGKRVYWINRLTKLEESARLFADATTKTFYSSTSRKNGKRVITFVCTDGHYRSLYLDAIIRTS